MSTYRDIDGDSGVASYEIGSDHIWVHFKRGGSYRYSEASVGSANLRQMIRLAQAGNGLNSFISRNVRAGYDMKR